jgi:TfoX/Sxy family transcriptional regulator of competence genes
MASSKEYLTWVLDQLSGLEEVSYKAMMGEFLLCYRGKIIGGIYDNRLLLKPTEAARRLLPVLSYELPYEGGKEMLLVTEADQPELLCRLFEESYPELPSPKPKKKPSSFPGKSCAAEK